jgi:alkaline phosphatase
VLAFLAVLLAFLPVHAGEPATAKYVILMIGDGMGVAQRAAAEYYLYACEAGRKDPPGMKTLCMNRFPAQGITTTYSQEAYVTDSAAAATAIACGQKTLNHALSMDYKLKTKLKTLAEIAKERGLKVGIVTSVSIDHATPAAFYAHQPHRDNLYEIAMELAASSFDYFGGGAAKGAQPTVAKGRPSPVEAARKNGFVLVTRREELQALKPGGQKVWAFNHTCDEEAALYYEIDRPPDHIALAEFAAKGLELLDNPRGFFLMVEGGKIDWACHAHDAATAVREVVAFDQAVEAAFRFYEKHPHETLIVVTGDHETGGLTIGSTTQYAAFPRKLQAQKMSSWAFRKTIEQLRKRSAPFQDALQAAKPVFGLSTLSPADLQELEAAYAWSLVPKTQRPFALFPDLFHYGGEEPFGIKCTEILDRQAGFLWATPIHSGSPVQTSAIGVGHELFDGYHDNTDLFRKLLSVLPPAPAPVAAP